MVALPRGASEKVFFKKLFVFSKPEIDFVFKNAKRLARTGSFTLLGSPTKNSFGKLLLIAPKKIGKANKRNLLRRRVKAIFYEEKLYEQKKKFILLAREGATDASFAELKGFLLRSVDQINFPATS